MPAGQSEQDEAPAKENVPGGHGEQEEEPADEKVPAAQETQGNEEVDCTVAEYDPGGHKEQGKVEVINDEAELAD